MASGASGAELANIVNEGALRAVRNGRKVIEQSDLEESVEVVIAGYQKKNAILPTRKRKPSPIMKSDMRWWRPCRPTPRRYRK